MDDEDLRWIEVYEEGDIIHFCSDSIKKDLLIVYSKYIDNSEHRSVFFDDKYAEASMWYALFHRNHLLRGNLKITKENRFPVLIDLSLHNQNTNLCDQQVLSTDDYAAKNYHLLQLKDTIISGIEYHDCFIIDETNSWQLETSEPSDEIQSFIWSKSKGLIQYTMKTGEVFTREEY